MKLALTLSLLTAAEAAETVLGAYIFHRHGDRTPKALAPTNLTTLGYEQVYTSGQYYRSRYLSGASKIHGINEDLVKLSQLAVTSPVDNVLQSSAMGFLQGLYPPVRTVQTLGNGNDVQAPMDGYQLIPVNTVETGAGSEDAGWLQDASSCPNAKTSSNAYFSSSEYASLDKSSRDLFSSLVPVVNNALSAEQVSFKNAYVVYDLLNVAKIHNSSIPSSDVLTNATFSQLSALAYAHEWNLAYNASDNMRAIAGMQLAGEVVAYLNSTISSRGANKLGVQFGAYATALSFFGLADLPAANPAFKDVMDYASSLVFELVTSADTTAGFPDQKDLAVRFLFHNGTASNSSEPTAYPLFGTDTTTLPWTDFASRMAAVAVADSQTWCAKCGSTTGACAAFAGEGTTSTSTHGGAGAGNAISPAVGGVIGALVTLAVVLGSLALVMLLGGFRLVSKKALAGARVEKVGVETKA